jgi:hypothetical protein
MKFHAHREHPNGEHIRAVSFRAPDIFWRLGEDGRHYLVWGILRLILGVVQMSFAVTAFLCMIFVGPTSSSTLTCAAISTIATFASRLLFHGQSGPRR